MNKALVKTEIVVQDSKISVMRVGDTDYISLTDLARFKSSELPANVIIHWLSNRDSALFVGLWEILNNPDFNLTEFREIASFAFFSTINSTLSSESIEIKGFPDFRVCGISEFMIEFYHKLKRGNPLQTQVF